jgi:hypothetical protein
VTSSSTSNSRDFYLDYLPVRVYYTVIQENDDGDNFFISPTSADMKGIFEFIGNQVCPAIAAPPPASPTTANLIILNHVINDNGGTNHASDFTINITATNPSQNNFAGAEYPGTTVSVDPGAYSIDASALSGYTKVIGASCSGTVAAGDVVTCVVTNDDVPPAPPPGPPTPPPLPNIDVNTWVEQPL